MDIQLREGRIEDLPRLRDLIVELAIFEKEPDAVTNTLEMMQEDGFGPNAVYGFIVAELDGNIIGASIYYYRYSTWKGKRMYLEDLIVTEEHRGIGAGKLLFEETIAIGKATGCTGMMWQVLDWNEPAIEFYKKYNSNLDGGWINCNMEF